jgi:hypothetical protein
MDVTLWRSREGEPSDAEIEKDVAELRSLLEKVDGPSEPHPAYWQNFVVRVQARIDEEGGRRKRRSFSTAWASVGAVAVMTVIVVATGLLDKQPAVIPNPVKPALKMHAEAPADLAAAYNSTDTKSIILSGGEVNMINAIVSDKSDDAVFEAMVDEQEL